MTETLKPGTPCECADPECAAVVGMKHKREAVRMVTVGAMDPSVYPTLTDRQKRYANESDSMECEIPMCEPCARWHEEKQKEGANAR